MSNLFQAPMKAMPLILMVMVAVIFGTVWPTFSLQRLIIYLVLDGTTKRRGAEKCAYQPTSISPRRP